MGSSPVAVTLTPQEETLLGNPSDFKVLPIDSVNLFRKNGLFLLNIFFFLICIFEHCRYLYQRVIFMPFFMFQPFFWLINQNPCREHLSAKISLVSLMVVLLTDQHSSRGSTLEIIILMLRYLSLKYFPISMRHFTISKGESLLILFVPQ